MNKIGIIRNRGRYTYRMYLLYSILLSCVFSKLFIILIPLCSFIITYYRAKQYLDDIRNKLDTEDVFDSNRSHYMLYETGKHLLLEIKLSFEKLYNKFEKPNKAPEYYTRLLEDILLEYEDNNVIVNGTLDIYYLKKDINKPIVIHYVLNNESNLFKQLIDEYKTPENVSTQIHRVLKGKIERRKFKVNSVYQRYTTSHICVCIYVKIII